MARRVFFSFHYQRDIFRVNVVRNHDVTKTDIEQSGFFDHSLWEETKKKGSDALVRLINDGLRNTSVTVVLAGRLTYSRPWARYELAKSVERGNALVTIFINGIQSVDKTVDEKGPDPLEFLYFSGAKYGSSAQLQQYEGNKWVPYGEISTKAMAPNLRSAGSGRFSKFGFRYDWIADNGYVNFRRWVDRAAAAAGK